MARRVASILESKTPLTVTRQGETLDVFVQAGLRLIARISRRSSKPTKVEIEAVRQTGEEMDEPIAATGTTAEELAADFEKARREKPAAGTYS